LNTINIICIISRLLEFAYVCLYERVFENVCTASFGITYTAYHILSRQQIILQYVFIVFTTLYINIISTFVRTIY